MIPIFKIPASNHHKSMELYLELFVMMCKPRNLKRMWRYVNREIQKNIHMKEDDTYVSPK